MSDPAPRSSREADLLSARGRLPEAVVASALDHPWRWLLAWGLVCVLVTPGVLALRIETSTDSLLDQRSASWRFYQESLAIFGGDEIIAVMLRGDEPFAPDVLEQVVKLSGHFASLPGVRRVDSLATVPLVEATGAGDLSLEPSLAMPVPRSQEARRALAARLRTDRVARDGLVSRDGRAFALNIQLQKGAERHYDAIFTEIEAVGARVPLTSSGVPVFRVETTRRTSTELMLFVPLTVVIVGLFLALLFARFRAALIALSVSGVAVWIVVGAMGLLGSPMTLSTVILPPVLLALGSAYCMHFLTGAEGQEGDAGLRLALRRVALPVSLSGLTTAIGFLAASFVGIQAVRDVSGYGAMGVIVLVAACLSLAPAALVLWPLQGKSPRFEDWLGDAAPRRLVDGVAAHGRLIAGFWLTLLLLAGIGVAQLEVETDAVLLFQPSDPIRVAYDEIREQLSGISPMNVVVRAAPGRSLSEPEVVAAVDALGAHLSQRPEVGKVLAYTDLLRQLHGGFNEDASGPLPLERDLIEQYLLLLESKDYFFDLLTMDHTAANVLLRADDNGSGALLAVAREAERWWSENGAPGFEVQTTGIMHEFARSEDRIAEGQIRGLFFAILAIGAILFAIVGSHRLALMALIPNAVPVFLAFGFMGALGIPLDAGTVFVGNLALGIAVDDTVHELAEYHRRRVLGDGVRAALEGAFSQVLRPIVYTTIVVATGFMILGISSFTYTRNLGLLTAGVMFLCLLADLVLLPAILLSWGDGRPDSSRHEVGQST